MAPMILYCDACSAQNFVSEERRSVREIPPLCWKCGKPLPQANETASGTRESNKGIRGNEPTGRSENA